MKTPEAVGILGGTFDPVHLAHVALARVASEKLQLAEVLWVPAGQPPHRNQPRTTPADRCAMVQAAIAAEPRFSLDTSEAEHTMPSYTVHTLARLRQQFGLARPLVLLMGADAFRSLPSWHRWQDIFTFVHVGVATRPGYPLDDFAAPLAAEFAARCRPANADFSHLPAGTIVPFELVAGTVSATEVRHMLATGTPPERLRELLPVPVLDYIRQHHLYGT